MPFHGCAGWLARGPRVRLTGSSFGDDEREVKEEEEEEEEEVRYAAAAFASKSDVQCCPVIWS